MWLRSVGWKWLSNLLKSSQRVLELSVYSRLAATYLCRGCAVDGLETRFLRIPPAVLLVLNDWSWDDTAVAGCCYSPTQAPLLENFEDLCLLYPTLSHKGYGRHRYRITSSSASVSGGDGKHALSPERAYFTMNPP